MSKKESEYTKEHKDLKEFDVKILKEILKERDKYDEKKHSRRAVLITLRADETIRVLVKKDNNDSNSFKRKINLRAMSQ